MSRRSPIKLDKTNVKVQMHIIHKLTLGCCAAISHHESSSGLLIPKCAWHTVDSSQDVTVLGIGRLPLSKNVKHIAPSRTRPVKPQIDSFTFLEQLRNSFSKPHVLPKTPPAVSRSPHVLLEAANRLHNVKRQVGRQSKLLCTQQMFKHFSPCWSQAVGQQRSDFVLAPVPLLLDEAIPVRYQRFSSRWQESEQAPWSAALELRIVTRVEQLARTLLRWTTVEDGVTTQRITTSLLPFLSAAPSIDVSSQYESGRKRTLAP
ncbi:hypothetical protein IWX50DRAFT_678923 [Phyllosticta citricarpa]|uniref:Uncharacterized protein n=1 Tax=Phyllosticta citricarpa TaxID=55181 RepID=A0ABR1MGG6_9PEZI